MNRTLSEIDAIIEKEVELRCADRMRAFARDLRTMADRVSAEMSGARPAQMSDGIEIRPAEKVLEAGVYRVTEVTGSMCLEKEVAAVLQDPQAAECKPVPSLAPAIAGDVPEGSPDWLLQACRPEKERAILRRIAVDGGVTLQEVIYHFSPPIKEAYASVILSGVNRALKKADMKLERDAEGIYRVRAEA